MFVGSHRTLPRANRHGRAPDRARASIRISLGKQTTTEDIDFALELVPETVARLRALSPVYKKEAVRS